MIMANPPYTEGNTFCVFFSQDPTALDSAYPVMTFASVPSGWLWVLYDNTPDAAVWEMFQHRKGVVKAWVNFNGTNGAINDNFDIASVTRNGTGDYTITFSFSMPNANYASSATALGQGVIASISSQSTDSLRIMTSKIVAGLTIATDPTVVCASILTS